jgi:hypothetical protein
MYVPYVCPKNVNVFIAIMYLKTFLNAHLHPISGALLKSHLNVFSHFEYHFQKHLHTHLNRHFQPNFDKKNVYIVSVVNSSVGRALSFSHERPRLKSQHGHLFVSLLICDLIDF